jgi:hypothetical protein
MNGFARIFCVSRKSSIDADNFGVRFDATFVSFMECGDVTPLLFLSLAWQRAQKKQSKNKKNKETKAVLHHRTP